MSSNEARLRLPARTIHTIVVSLIVPFVAACGSGEEAVETATGDSPDDSFEQVGQLDLTAFEELSPLPELRAVDRSIDLGFDWREAIPRDAINPVYSPKFVTASEIGEEVLGEELVMGLNIGGDARAYPVGIMRFREIVNDEVGGVPLLVTW